jgi:hypothetical protein
MVRKTLSIGAARQGELWVSARQFEAQSTRQHLRVAKGGAHMKCIEGADYQPLPTADVSLVRAWYASC